MNKKSVNQIIARSLLFALYVGLASSSARAAFPSLPVVHLINDSGQDIYNVLSLSTPFVTDFRGTGDLTVTELAGSLDPDYTDTFGGTYSAGNPDYITNFIGAATNGTGDGTLGDLRDIQTLQGLSLQFDFATRLGTNDRLFVVDCDLGEQYQVQAFVKNGSTYTQETPLNWVVQNFPGSTQEATNSSFPAWNPTNGTLTAQTSAGLNEPLTVFTPDQPVDRVIITQLPGGNGTAAIQFFELPANLGTLTVTRSNANVLITVLPGLVSPFIQTTTKLVPPTWTTLTNVTLNNIAFPATIALPITNTQQYFRLTY